MYRRVFVLCLLCLYNVGSKMITQNALKSLHCSDSLCNHRNMHNLGDCVWRYVKMHLNINFFVCVTSRDIFWIFPPLFSISSILQSLRQISFIQVDLKISLKYRQQKAKCNGDIILISIQRDSFSDLCLIQCCLFRLSLNYLSKDKTHVECFELQ